MARDTVGSTGVIGGFEARMKRWGRTKEKKNGGEFFRRRHAAGGQGEEGRNEKKTVIPARLSETKKEGNVEKEKGKKRGRN